MSFAKINNYATHDSTHPIRTGRQSLRSAVLVTYIYENIANRNISRILRISFTQKCVGQGQMGI